MTSRFSLVKPVLGVYKGEGKVTTIPAGSIVDLPAKPLFLGTMDVWWKGQLMTVFSQDILSSTQPEQSGQSGWNWGDTPKIGRE